MFSYFKWRIDELHAVKLISCPALPMTLTIEPLSVSMTLTIPTMRIAKRIRHRLSLLPTRSHFLVLRYLASM